MEDFVIVDETKQDIIPCPLNKNHISKHCEIWNIQDIGILVITESEICFYEKNEKNENNENNENHQYVSDMSDFIFFDTDILLMIVELAIQKNTIQFQKQNDSLTIICPYYTKYDGHTDIRFNLIKSDLNNDIEIYPNNIYKYKSQSQYYKPSSMLINVFSADEPLLLFPGIDPIDFMKFVDTYCIFQRQKYSVGEYNLTYKLRIQHNYEKYGKYKKNELVFIKDIDHPNEINNKKPFTLNLNENKVNQFINITKMYDNYFRWTTWYYTIICSYLSLRYMYNYIDGKLVDKNKRYLFTSNSKSFSFNTSVYNYTLNTEYFEKYMPVGYTIDHITKDNQIQEVYEFEKWW